MFSIDLPNIHWVLRYLKGVEMLQGIFFSTFDKTEPDQDDYKYHSLTSELEYFNSAQLSFFFFSFFFYIFFLTCHNNNYNILSLRPIFFPRMYAVLVAVYSH